MIKELNLKLILQECFALIFIISGIDRLYVAFNGEKFDALINENWKKFELLTNVRIGQFFANQAYWTLAILIIGILIVGLINWKNKFGIINSIVVLILTFGISATGIYSSGIINRYLNYFCGIFAKGYGIAFLIGGLIILLIGILILWKTIMMNKKHSTQHRL
ncbi:hypothetical protein GCM10007962_32640 [Yeosuana aromativorans]|uniref:Uncharacterized protein n=1 Tax=Yeosuana aromativorans TaxID=288019 RepID=A0A8J3FJ97_9FLAO|nr:hypothetical protein [Yeosuana aromativorans]GGK35758.1 hypothetical protein GCM10007962_32640 [Yeosuana aromativorans]